jgi:hypothetical protein
LKVITRSDELTESCPKSRLGNINRISSAFKTSSFFGLGDWGMELCSKKQQGRVESAQFYRTLPCCCHFCLKMVPEGLKFEQWLYKK